MKTKQNQWSHVAGLLEAAVLAGLVLAGTARTSLAQVVSGSTFTRITTGVVVNDYGSYWGSAWVDYDNDGYIDLFVSAGGMTYSNVVNRLYHNNGDGTFRSLTAADAGDVVGESHEYAGCTWGDYDNNGWPDAYLFCRTNRLYRNVGGVTQRVHNAGVGYLSGAQGGVWVDYDRDGWLDLFEGSGSGIYNQRNMLYHNQGDGTFSGLTTGPIYEENVYITQKSAWGDYDGDGWPDLVFTGKPSAAPGFQTWLYRNLGGGQFERVTNNAIAQDAGKPLCPSWADYDNDGRLDLFMGQINSGPNKLFHNEGNGQFSVLLLGGAGINWPGAWGDYDNDGHLDLFIGRGGTGGVDQRNQLFHNNGDGTFTEMLDLAPATFSGRSGAGIWGDYDNDGFLDLFVPHVETWGTSLLYHNDGTNGNHWVMIKLVGTISNRGAIGARVKALTTIFGRPVAQMRAIGPNTSDGQNDPRTHFGLGDATNVETLRIEWPSGQVTELHHVRADQILTVEEPNLKVVGRSAIGTQLALAGRIGSIYDLYTRTNLTEGEEWRFWQRVTGTGGVLTITDTDANGASQRFYKSVQP